MNENIETAQPQLERERTQEELRAREEELAFKREELRLKLDELAFKRDELQTKKELEAGGRKWSFSPVVTAVLVAVFGVFGTIIGAITQGLLNKQLEQAKFEFSKDIENQKFEFSKDIENQKNEGSLILKMVETGDINKAQRNLLFLVQAGLIQDYKGKIAILASDSETVPVLPVRPETVGLGTHMTPLSQTDANVLTSRIKDERLQYYVDRYSGKTVLDDLGRITSRHVRHPDMPRIVNALVEDFKAIPNSPFHIFRHEFTHEGPRVLHNIVAELRGESNDQVLITANLDSTAAASRGFNAAKDPAPGADNNGSGLAAVLVIAEAFAELFQERIPRVTVRFVLFNATQQGLVGSKAYAREQALGKVNIVAVYHMQMIGFDGNKDGAFEIHAAFAPNATVELRSGWLAHRIGAVRTQLSQRLTPQLYTTSRDDPAQGRSDHASFQERGIPACVVSQDFFSLQNADANPNYQTALDTGVDYSYAADIARLVAGAAVLTVNSEPTK